MGSGKSSIGSKLAHSLKKNFIDIDEMIELESGSSIKTIFKEYGENYFRDLETRELEKIVNKDENFIVSTGGGIILKEENWKLMESAGISIYLKSSIENLWSRLSSDEGRPLLSRLRKRSLMKGKIYMKKQILSL